MICSNVSLLLFQSLDRLELDGDAVHICNLKDLVRIFYLLICFFLF